VNGRLAIVARYGILSQILAFGHTVGVVVIELLSCSTEIICVEQTDWYSPMAIMRNASGTAGDITKFVWFDTVTQLLWPQAPNTIMKNSLGRLQWPVTSPVCDIVTALFICSVSTYTQNRQSLVNMARWIVN